MSLTIGMLLFCSMKMLGDPGFDRTITLNNIPTKVMVVEGDYVTVAYDFSKFKEFTISNKNKIVIELLELRDIETRCKKER